MVESFFADLPPAIKSDWRVGYKIVAYNAISVGLGRQKRLFCVCAAETIIIVIINIIVYIYIFVVVVALCILSFLSCFATQSYV